MVLKTRIPLLKDHHNHPYLYAALIDGIDLSSVQTKAEALSLIRSAGTEMIVAFGWNDSLYDLTVEDLHPANPTVLLNRSLHGFIMNQSAIEVLKATHGALIARRDDSNWVEKQFPQVLHFIMDLKTGSDENLKTFYHDLLGRGVWHVDEMSLQGDREIDFLISFDLLMKSALYRVRISYSAQTVCPVAQDKPWRVPCSHRCSLRG